MKITTLITELNAANVKQMTKGLQNKYATLSKPQAKDIATGLIEYKGKVKGCHPAATLQNVVDKVQDSCNNAGLTVVIDMA